MMARVLLVLIAILVAAPASAAPCVFQPLPFWASGDNPTSFPPIQVSPADETALIAQFGIDMDVMADEPGGTDPSDLDGSHRRLLNALKFLEQHDFDSSKTWRQMAGDALVDIEPDPEMCNAYTNWWGYMDVGRRLLLGQNLLVRSMVVAHEARHTHGSGFGHGDRCDMGDDSCDPTWGYTGGYHFSVVYLFQAVSEGPFTQINLGVRRTALAVANSYLNGAFELHPGFNLSLPDTGPATVVAWDWSDGEAVQLAHFGDPGTGDQPFEAIVGVRVVVSEYLPVMHGGAPRYVATSLALDLRRVELQEGGGAALTTTHTVTHTYNPEYGVPVDWQVLDVDLAALGRPQSVVTGLLLKGGASARLGVRARLLASGGGLGREETFQSAGLALDESAFEVNLRAASDRIVTGVGMATVSTGFHASIRDDLPRPFSTVVGGTGGSVSRLSCPDGQIVVGTTQVTHPENGLVGLFGLLCMSEVDITDSVGPAAANLWVVHGHYRDSTGFSVAPGSRSYASYTTLLAGKTPVNVLCFAGDSLTGLHVRSGAAIDAVSMIRCTEHPSTGDGNYGFVYQNQSQVGGTGGERMRTDCEIEGFPQRVKGLYVRSGWWTDAIALQCLRSEIG